MVVETECNMNVKFARNDFEKTRVLFDIKIGSDTIIRCHHHNDNCKNH